MKLKIITEKTKLKYKFADYAATILGLLTSLATAFAVIDFDNFQFNKPTDLMKLFVIGMPAIGGFLSTIKTK